MANCQNYDGTMADVADVSDVILKTVVRNHMRADFWEFYRDRPDQLAWLRRWAMVCRREARRRGLL